MPLFDCVKGVGISEIVCAFPEQHYTLHDYAPNLLNEKTAFRMGKSTGFTSLRIAPERMTTSDLFAAAAEKLLTGRNREDIAGVVFVSKTADYDMPATSYILQDRLALSHNTICLDIREGCAGFVRGLYVAAVLAQRLGKAVLLGCGDTNSRLSNPNDRATRFLLGDGAAAVLVEPGGQDIPFALASYGDKKDMIIMENSGYRLVDNPKNDGYFYMDGLEVLNFSLKEVPDVVRAFMSRNKLTDEDITLYAFHQANRLILESLADELGVDRAKAPFVQGDIGNTSSATIPSVISRTGEALHRSVLCCSFGVGMSVGVCLADFSRTKTSEVFIS